MGRKDSITGCVGVIVWHSHLQRLFAARQLPNMSSTRWAETVLAHASSPSRQLGLWHCQNLPGLQRSQPRISLGTKAPSLRIPCLQAAPDPRRPERPCPVFPWAQSRRKWLWVVLPSRKADWFGCSHPLKASNDVCRVWRRRGSQGRPGLRGRGGMIAPGGRPGAMGDCP